MSNRKTKRERRLAEERQKEYKLKIKELEELKSKLELKLREQNKEKRRELHKRNLRVLVYSCNALTPYIVSIGVTIGVFKLLGGGYPFHIDEITKYKAYNLEYKTDEYAIMNEEYRKNGFWDESLPSNSLVIYTPWEQEADKYVRSKRIYNLDNITLRLYDAVLMEDYVYIANYLTDYKEERQTCNKMYENVPNDFYFEASLHMFNKDEFFKYDESDLKNIVITIIELVLGFGVGGFIAFKRDFEFFWEMEHVNDEYKCSIKAIRKTENEMEETNEQILSLTKNKGENLYEK